MLYIIFAEFTLHVLWTLYFYLPTFTLLTLCYLVCWIYLIFTLNWTLYFYVPTFTLLTLCYLVCWPYLTFTLNSLLLCVYFYFVTLLNLVNLFFMYMALFTFNLLTLHFCYAQCTLHVLYFERFLEKTRWIASYLTLNSQLFDPSNRSHGYFSCQIPWQLTTSCRTVVVRRLRCSRQELRGQRIADRSSEIRTDSSRIQRPVSFLVSACWKYN